MSINDVIFRRDGSLGRITLNRPKALNAITLEMCDAMLGQLTAWAADESVKGIVIDGAPGRAFAAGGDIRAIYDAGKKHDGSVMEFFKTEYKLNTAIKEFSKPYVALIDGIAMGGGLGVSVHGRYRAVTENAIVAMPETAIGLFPDIGASHFLNLLRGQLGMYLALTGNRIGPADAVFSGLATHLIPTAKLSLVSARMREARDAASILSELAEDAGEAPLARDFEKINRVFAKNSVEAILDALDHEGEWGRTTAELLRTRSPTSLKLTFRQIREGAKRDFRSCMRMEYRIVARAMEGHDFYEGVRAALIDKDQRPRWQPSRLEDVSDEDIARYFAPLKDAELAL